MRYITPVLYLKELGHKNIKEHAQDDLANKRQRQYLDSCFLCLARAPLHYSQYSLTSPARTVTCLQTLIFACLFSKSKQPRTSYKAVV